MARLPPPPPQGWPAGIVPTRAQKILGSQPRGRGGFEAAGGLGGGSPLVPFLWSCCEIDPPIVGRRRGGLYYGTLNFYFAV